MTERGIILRPWEVRAVLEGRLSELWRVVKLREFGQSTTRGYDWTFRDRHELWNDVRAERIAKWCPLGHPGDVLWGLETHAHAHPLQAEGRPSAPSTAGIPGPPKVDYRVVYRADGELRPVYWIDEYPFRALAGEEIDEGSTRWTPPLGMPRSASRITLRVEEVRVQRVQDIDEAGARAAGCRAADYATGRECNLDPGAGSYRLHFRSTWDQHNPRHPWSDNPWAWRVRVGVVDGSA